MSELTLNHSFFKEKNFVCQRENISFFKEKNLVRQIDKHKHLVLQREEHARTANITQ